MSIFTECTAQNLELYFEFHCQRCYECKEAAQYLTITNDLCKLGRDLFELIKEKHREIGVVS